MSNSAEIRYVHKAKGDKPHERITHIGGLGSQPWKLTQGEAVALIERGDWRFYISAGNGIVRVAIAVSSDGHKYLKTELDGEQPTGLLILPECPSSGDAGPATV